MSVIVKPMYHLLFGKTLRQLIRISDHLFYRNGNKDEVDVAFISNFRDSIDVQRLGFWDIQRAPDFISNTRYYWEGVRGRLFLIGSVTGQIGGDTATSETIARARKQFFQATQSAVEMGAKVILLAAATKRLFRREEIEESFPGVIFTLGDNFTGLLLGERINEAFRFSGLDPKGARVLIIAPYGLLGGVSLHYLLQSGAGIIGMGSPKRRDLLERIREKYNIEAVYSFEEVRELGGVDMAAACNSAPAVQLNRERIETIRRKNKRLIVVDPNEPSNITYDAYQECQNSVLRYDAGNGYSPQLLYVLGASAYKQLRMSKGVTWGCFAEAFLIYKHLTDNPEFGRVNWFDISPSNIGLLYRYYGNGDGRFALPSPSCFNKPIDGFSINLS